MFGITQLESRGAITKESWIILENLSMMLLLGLMPRLLMELLSEPVKSGEENVSLCMCPEFRAIVSLSEYSLQLGWQLCWEVKRRLRCLLYLLLFDILQEV